MGEEAREVGVMGEAGMEEGAMGVEVEVKEEGCQ